MEQKKNSIKIDFPPIEWKFICECDFNGSFNSISTKTENLLEESFKKCTHGKYLGISLMLLIDSGLFLVFQFQFHEYGT